MLASIKYSTDTGGGDGGGGCFACCGGGGGKAPKMMAVEKPRAYDKPGGGTMERT
jgi:hypothetical protein